jgi:hypothetical protein
MKNIARLLFVFIAAAFVFLGQGEVAFGQADQGGAPNLSFDHNTTGFILENAHKLVACETCHTSGTFRGTPRTCDTCHAGAGARAPGKPLTHIPTGSVTCDNCHTTTSWTSAKMNHAALKNMQCSSCHNGSYAGYNALGKPATHIPAIAFSTTSAACETCHTNTVAFAPATMNHAGTAGQCILCHSGGFVAQNAQTKGVGHPDTTSQCDACHNSTTTWFAKAFDHIATPPVDGRCSTCHDGSRATGKPGNHIPTAGQCDNCHVGTVTFTGSRMNHAGTGGQCSTCHSGGFVAFNALAKPATHIATTASCDACHQSTTTWLGAVFDHTSASPPVAGRCATCHDGKIALGQSAASPRHLTTTSSCDTCHTNFTAFAPATMNHLGMSPSVASNCSSCHDGSLVAINAQSKPATHVSTAAQCDTCHSGSVSKSYTTWATGVFDHVANAISIGGHACGVSCHNGSTGQGLSKPSSHIPTTAACDVCHSNFTAFAPATTNHAGTTGPVAAGNCSSCHSGTYTAVNALTKPATHIPTTSQCDTCHTNGFATWAPAVMSHASTAGPVAAGNCATCHGGAYLAQNAQAKPSTHIPTAQSCDTCHGTTAWKPTTFSHSGITIGGGTCATCHGTSALGKSASHLPTTAACDVCHTNFTAFSPAIMNHTGTSGPAAAGNCATCHGGAYLSINAQVKPSTHISTTAQCDSCHTGSVSRNYTTWATGVFNHVGVTAGSCATCHNGTSALGKPSTHIPTGAPCDTCHTNTTAFAPATMDHANTTSPVAIGNCSSCHNGGFLFAKATAKPSTHVPTSAQCDTCHTGGYVSWTGATFVHSASAVGTCATCHNGTTALGKPSSHVPTTGQCSTCHGNYVAFKPASMNHAGSAGLCSTCHNGSYVAVNALAKPATHVPTGAQCDTCHINGFVSFSPSTMNHLSTNSPLVAGNCSTCHSGAYTSQNAQDKPATHVVTAAQCDTCHSGSVSKNFTTWATGTFNHTGVVIGGHACGTSCHNGTAGQGLSKPGTHIPTTAACDVCHNSFTAFSPATMSHANTTGPAAANNCISCHSGTYIAVNAQTKPATHIVTAQSCDTCHGTTAWKPTTFSHDKVTPPVVIGAGTCATCHGVTALGKSASHLPTTAACDVCHSNFTAFTPATMNHASTAGPLAAGSCSTCHSGAYLSINAQTKSPTHVQTSAQCDTCHKSTSTWANATFAHDASAVGNCSNCHNGTTALGKPGTHIPTTAQCSTCHNNYTAFKPAVMSHAGTTGPVAVGNCSSCHNGSYTFANALTMPVTHIPTANQCDSCHKAGYASFAPATMNHTGLAGQCSTCHGGAYVSQNAQTKPATHVATAAQCDTCHSGSVSGNYTTWATGTFNHAGVIIGGHACGTSCHTGAAGQGLSKPATHIPTTAACDICHTNFTAFNPAVMSHANTVGPVAAANCSTCHSGAYTYANAQAKSATHVVTSAQCDTCHNSTVAWTGASFAHAASAVGTCSTCHNGTTALGKPSLHIPTTAQCDTCHTNYTAFKPASMNHTGTAGQCSTCHSGTYVALNALAKPAGTGHIPTAAQCDTCHNNGFVSFNPSPMNHLGTSAPLAAGNCSTCHSGTYLAQNAQTKPSTHVVTVAQCDTCHSGSVSKNYTTWATGTFNHAGVVIGGHACGTSCHNGTAGQGLSKPSTHIPTTAACDNCHNSFTAFAPATMSHSATTGPVAAANCISCHSGTYVAVNAQTKPASHIATALSCDTCHGTTAWLPTTFSHDKATPPVAIGGGTCATCHGTTALGKSASHLPTTAACDVCHTNFTAFTPATMNHASTAGPAAAGNCSTCHSGTYLSINAQVKSATHVVTSAQCDSCHTSTSTWANATFTHDASAVGKCSTCHGTTALGKPSTHIPTTAQCSTCHNNYTAFKPAVMSHTGTTGPLAVANCATCHGGAYVAVNALSKPATHIPTASQCDSCHKAGYAAWAPATMNHTGLAGQCSTCHSGAYVSQNAQSKPATHIATAAQCDTCHSGSVSGNYTTWATGTFNHAGVVIGGHACGTSCHTGAAGQGLSKPSTHIPTTAACDVCHTNFTSFNPGVMSHTGTTGPVATGNCATCHGGAYVAVNAQAKTATHISTTQSCDVCHKTTAWLPTSFAHTVAQGVTTTNCATCHDGVKATGKPVVHIPTSATCNVCHTTGVAWLPLITPYAHAGVAAGTCATCHTTAYPNIDVKPANHVPTADSCNICHSTSLWTPNLAFAHASVAKGTCASCHTGTYLGVPGKVSNHIPTTTPAGMPGNECSLCHTSTAVGGFATDKMNHGTMQTSCATCHDSLAPYLGSMRKITRGSGHHNSAGKDCSSSGCHKPLGKTGQPYSSWN